MNDLEMLELRAAAFHEAGHAVLVRIFRGIATPEIWKNDSGRPNEKAWVGTCRMLVPPGSVPFELPGRRLKRTPSRWRVYVGLAGHLAESMERGTEDQYWDLCNHLDAGFLSDSDVELMGGTLQYPAEVDVQRTLNLLRCVWHEVQLEAERLLAPHTKLWA